MIQQLPESPIINQHALCIFVTSGVPRNTIFLGGSLHSAVRTLENRIPAESSLKLAAGVRLASNAARPNALGK